MPGTPYLSCPMAMAMPPMFCPTVLTTQVDAQSELFVLIEKNVSRKLVGVQDARRLEK